MDSASRTADEGQGEFRMGNGCELSMEPGSALSGQTCCQATAKRARCRVVLVKAENTSLSKQPRERQTLNGQALRINTALSANQGTW